MTYDQSQLSLIKCGGIVSYLEGRNNIVLPDDLVTSNTLTELNVRVRRLENTLVVIPPPPSLEPTWDSLALRICRIKQKTDSSLPTRRTNESDFASMVPDTLEISIETLQMICADLTRPPHPAMPPPTWPKLIEDDQMLDVIRQRLCHAAGRNRIIVDPIPITRIEIYAQLIGMTLKFEDGDFPYLRGAGLSQPPSSTTQRLSSRA
ncbi:hypothetical protein G7Z17_g4543 [Cylindrodendrum hubeiense]|uniref:Uncharacterized protein n=1 Tax=Cylindrodendrum hubeiense TaxID=595255 RepID=A0A9P5H8K8_9HYPO|nr:hypothetical protein G7Z17_g4543 [Cylindrodendrum hubeiense]